VIDLAQKELILECPLLAQSKVEGQVYNVRLWGMVILLTTSNYSTHTLLMSASSEIPEKAEKSLITRLSAGRQGL